MAEWRQGRLPGKASDKTALSLFAAGPHVKCFDWGEPSLGGYMVEIKTATEGDAERVAALLTQLGYPVSTEFTREKIRELNGHPDGELAVAVADDKVVGFVSLHFIPQLAFSGAFARISYLCVDENIRNKGVGRRLESHCERLAKERGCDRVELHCHSRREQAHAFYHRRGYDEFPKYFMKKLVWTLPHVGRKIRSIW